MLIFAVIHFYEPECYRRTSGLFSLAVKIYKHCPDSRDNILSKAKKRGPNMTAKRRDSYGAQCFFSEKCVVEPHCPSLDPPPGSVVVYLVSDAVCERST